MRWCEVRHFIFFAKCCSKLINLNLLEFEQVLKYLTGLFSGVSLLSFYIFPIFLCADGSKKEVQRAIDCLCFNFSNLF